MTRAGDEDQPVGAGSEIAMAHLLSHLVGALQQRNIFNPYDKKIIAQPLQLCEFDICHWSFVISHLPFVFCRLKNNIPANDE